MLAEANLKSGSHQNRFFTSHCQPANVKLELVDTTVAISATTTEQPSKMPEQGPEEGVKEDTTAAAAAAKREPDAWEKVSAQFNGSAGPLIRGPMSLLAVLSSHVYCTNKD